jgi:hypothetical protein
MDTKLNVHLIMIYFIVLRKEFVSYTLKKKEEEIWTP